MSQKTSLQFTLTLTGITVTDPEDGSPLSREELQDNLVAIVQRVLSEGLITGDSASTLETVDSETVVTPCYPWHDDIGLCAEHLDEKYNPQGDGEHPYFTRSDWRADVREDVTLRGYWEWVAAMVECHDPDNDA
jgi:hypothetical protein